MISFAKAPAGKRAFYEKYGLLLHFIKAYDLT
jgi:hypothetical protein